MKTRLRIPSDFTSKWNPSGRRNEYFQPSGNSGLPWRDLPWIRQGIGALILSTLLWLVLLLPAQWKMERATDAAIIRRLFLRWSVAGWAATVLLFYGLWAMVTKR